MRRYMVPGVIVVVAVALLALLTYGVSSQGDSSSIDAQVARGHFPVTPNDRMALPVLGSSAKESLAAFRGRVVVLNVYASWCPPCAGEAPLLAREQHRLATEGATLVGITYQDNSSASEQFDRQYHITYPVLRDVSGNLARSLGVDGVPETFVINRAGRIQALEREPVTQRWLNQTLPSIVAARS